MMFEKPTENDFLAQLRMHHDAVISEFGREKVSIQANASAHGSLQSGRTIIVLLDATEAAVRKGAASMLGELRRAIQRTDLDPMTLRQLTIGRLLEMTEAVIGTGGWATAGRWIQSASVQKIIDERFSKIREQVTFWIRQFDVGFDEPAEPEPVGQVTNILNARDVIGPVQQGQGSLTQTAEIHFDAAGANRAIEDLKSELANSNLPEDQRHEIESDLATIEAQLKKPNPSMAIVREAGRSVRNITEGVIAGALTPQGLAAAALLARALGL